MSSPCIGLCLCFLFPFYEVFLLPVKGKDGDDDVVFFLFFNLQQVVLPYISTGHFTLH